MGKLKGHRIVLGATAENSKSNERCILYDVVKGCRSSYQDDGQCEICSHNCIRFFGNFAQYNKRSIKKYI